MDIFQKEEEIAQFIGGMLSKIKAAESESKDFARSPDDMASRETEDLYDCACF